MKRFIAIWILLSAGLNIWQMGRIAELDQMAIDHLEKHLASQLILIQFFNADIDLKSFITKCHKVLDDYLLMYNFVVGVE